MRSKKRKQLEDIGVYPPIYERIEDWPIYHLHQKRPQFAREVKDYILEHFMNLPNKELKKVLTSTNYLERIRIKEEPWKVDPPDEKSFWSKINKSLLKIADEKDEQKLRASLKGLLIKIIDRYVEEIIGTFNRKTFQFSRRFLTFFFSRLLNTATSGRFRRIFNSKLRLFKKLKVVGEVENIRGLFKKGTVVMVPTHFSNLDSILIGYVMDGILGFPSFYYGAGLNLYNSGIPAYFMNRMGTYRVDRRKKNPIYLHCLKGASYLALLHGTNSLFFPGGTRSRSGAIENKLKMGLLGTTIKAQRKLFQQDNEEKIFIVPMIMSYNFVLEAQPLIEQHLTRTGKEKYLRTSNQTSLSLILKFLWKILSKSSEITISFGNPMDILGNPVNEEGHSIGINNNKIQLADYFEYNGKITKDEQREEEYTRILSDKIVASFYKHNLVIPSHLVAFIAFNIVRRRFKDLDIYGILRLPADEIIISKIYLVQSIHAAVEIMRQDYQENKYLLDEALISEDDVNIIALGIENLGTFHALKPLTFDKNGDILSQNLKLLYYYHNRLDFYDIEKRMEWPPEPTTVE